MHKTLTISAAIIKNTQGETLLVRKAGTAFFMQPGGKVEAGEEPRIALVRELSEELPGFNVDPNTLLDLGRHEAWAANEPDTRLVAHLFSLVTDTTLTPAAEIAEALWVDPAAPTKLTLAPFTRDICLPLAAQL